MSEPTITQMPTLCAPEKLSEKELVDQVNYLRDSIMMQERTLHEVRGKMAEACALVNLLANHLWELVDAFEAGSEAQINDHLRMISETRKRGKEQKAKVH